MIGPDGGAEGDDDVFTAAWFLLLLLSSSFTAAAQPASPKYLKHGNNLCVVALNVHA